MDFKVLHCAAGLALATAAANASPALAADPALAGANYTRGDWQSAPPAAAMAPPPQVSSGMREFGSREAWLAECRRKTTPVEIDDDWNGHRPYRNDSYRRRHQPAPAQGPDSCEAYLLDYEAWVSAVSAGYARQAAATVAVAPQGGFCRPREGCGETVEYIEEYAAPRRAIRPRPDKRIRLVPDKRVRVQ